MITYNTFEETLKRKKWDTKIHILFQWVNQFWWFIFYSYAAALLFLKYPKNMFWNILMGVHNWSLLICLRTNTITLIIVIKRIDKSIKKQLPWLRPHIHICFILELNIVCEAIYWFLRTCNELILVYKLCSSLQTSNWQTYRHSCKYLLY